MSAKFPLGRLLITPGAVQALFDAKKHPAVYVARHHSGDWGDLKDCDKNANERDLRTGGRLLSCYILPTEAKLYIISECDRSYTTIMLAQEY